LYICLFMYICMYINTYVYIHIHTYTYIYIHIFIYIHTDIYIHIYLHTYIYIYIHTYKHTYVYIKRLPPVCPGPQQREQRSGGQPLLCGDPEPLVSGWTCVPTGTHFKFIYFLVVLFLLRYRLWILYSLQSLIFFRTYAFLAGLYVSV
jgi:hypothetical protein